WSSTSSASVPLSLETTSPRPDRLPRRSAATFAFRPCGRSWPTRSAWPGASILPVSWPTGRNLREQMRGTSGRGSPRPFSSVRTRAPSLEPPMLLRLAKSLDQLQPADATESGRKAYNCARLKQGGFPVPDALVVAASASQDDIDRLVTHPWFERWPPD